MRVYKVPFTLFPALTSPKYVNDYRLVILHQIRLHGRRFLSHTVCHPPPRTVRNNVWVNFCLSIDLSGDRILLFFDCTVTISSHGGS